MMQIKKDTKEKFTVYTPQNDTLSVNMAEMLKKEIEHSMSQNPPHIIVNLSLIKTAEPDAVQSILALQQRAYGNQTSFVICHVLKDIEPLFNESMNLVPTESEAWDIVQMEEIERELLGFDDDNSN